MYSNLFFETIFIPQKEGGYTIEVPSLPGCFSESETIEEGKENIKEAIELYLETLTERGITFEQNTQKEIIKMNIQITTTEESPQKQKAYA